MPEPGDLNFLSKYAHTSWVAKLLSYVVFVYLNVGSCGLGIRVRGVLSSLLLNHVDGRGVDSKG
jgi:hypothetical protein